VIVIGPVVVGTVAAVDEFGLMENVVGEHLKI
jgi:hypothetical protein